MGVDGCIGTIGGELERDVMEPFLQTFEESEESNAEREIEEIECIADITRVEEESRDEFRETLPVEGRMWINQPTNTFVQAIDLRVEMLRGAFHIREAGVEEESAIEREV